MIEVHVWYQDINVKGENVMQNVLLQCWGKTHIVFITFILFLNQVNVLISMNIYSMLHPQYVMYTWHFQ